MYLARRLTSLSYADIGRGLGHRDHTTIMHAERRLTERLAHDPVTQQAVQGLSQAALGTIHAALFPPKA